MATTTNLGITLLEEGQRSKETAINTAISALDAYLGVTTTVANLPDATTHTGMLAIATDVDVGDETWLVYSNGTSWLKVVQVNGGAVSA